MALICYVCYKLIQYSSTKIDMFTYEKGLGGRGGGIEKCTHRKKVNNTEICCDFGINEKKKLLVVC